MNNNKLYYQNKCQFSIDSKFGNWPVPIKDINLQMSYTSLPVGIHRKHLFVNMSTILNGTLKTLENTLTI